MYLQALTITKAITQRTKAFFLNWLPQIASDPLCVPGACTVKSCIHSIPTSAIALEMERCSTLFNGSDGIVGYKPTADAIRECPNLTGLYVIRNVLSSTSMLWIADAVSMMANLRGVSCGRDNMQSSGAVAKLVFWHNDQRYHKHVGKGCNGQAPMYGAAEADLSLAKSLGKSIDDVKDVGKELRQHLAYLEHLENSNAKYKMYTMSQFGMNDANMHTWIELVERCTGLQLKHEEWDHVDVLDHNTRDALVLRNNEVYACRAPPKKRKLTVQDMCTYGTKGGSNGAGRIIMSLNMYADAEVVLQSAPSKEKVQRFYRFHIKHGDMWILSQQARDVMLHGVVHGVRLPTFKHHDKRKFCKGARVSINARLGIYTPEEEQAWWARTNT
mmetsp:Transcript_34167/g.65274  ORF Transcript_34167/g.65274 Transcript_34167/m.65274 type:complete len:386 (+) Transcript_34167:1423-2580(+)